jgi:uncharacterized protein (DUF2062 family)
MSAMSRFPAIAGTVSVGAFVAAITAIPSVREYLAKVLGSRVSSNMWKIAALGIAIANFKHIPGIWHVSLLEHSRVANPGV